MSCLVWIVCIGLLPTPRADAEVRAVYEDAIVVERSELIVVGRLKPSSITYVAFEEKEHGWSGWQHRARLVISEVLKGTVEEKDIPIVIHYGLTPLVGGRTLRAGRAIDALRGDASDPEDLVEVFDTADSVVRRAPLVRDAAEDNLWFLRRLGGRYGRQPGDGDLGIADPEDLRPLMLKAYLTTYLEAAPEEEIRRQQGMLANAAWRAQRFLDHLTFQRALEIEDVQGRLQVLKRLYLARQSWDHTMESRDAIIASGVEAADVLTEMFDDPTLLEHRTDVISLFRAIDHRGAAPRLVGLLEVHNAFWRDAGSVDWDHPVAGEVRRRYAEIVAALYALEQIGDARAVPVVKATKQLWLQRGARGDAIVEACDRFLKRFVGE